MKAATLKNTLLNRSGIFCTGTEGSDPSHLSVLQ